ncbi:unnamed protein product, partial [Ceratitis capitata]
NMLHATYNTFAATVPQCHKVLTSNFQLTSVQPRINLQLGLGVAAKPNANDEHKYERRYESAARCM